VNRFESKIAAEHRKRRSKPHATWHLDEVYLKVDGRLVYLWRAGDAEGEVLDVLVKTRTNKRAALTLMRKLQKKYGFVRQLPANLESQYAMNAVDGATIERRIRIRCKGSRAWDPRKDSSQCMQQHKILSTSNAISPRQERTEPSRHRPCRHGVKSSLRRESDVPRDLLRALSDNVKRPTVPLHRPAQWEMYPDVEATGKW